VVGRIFKLFLIVPCGQFSPIACGQNAMKQLVHPSSIQDFGIWEISFEARDNIRTSSVKLSLMGPICSKMYSMLQWEQNLFSI
jgi:hypothetical protein